MSDEIIFDPGDEGDNPRVLAVGIAGPGVAWVVVDKGEEPDGSRIADDDWGFGDWEDDDPDEDPDVDDIDRSLYSRGVW